MVIWSAPPSSASIAAATGSGYSVRRAWRSVATWSTLTPSRAGMGGMYARGPLPRYGLPERLHDLRRDRVGVRAGLLRVGPLDQDPDLVLRPREADEHAPVLPERALDRGDRPLDGGQLRERPPLLDHDVDQRLGHRLEAARQLRQRP